jgi:DNA-binding CsgD family transcriptional regulator
MSWRGCSARPRPARTAGRCGCACSSPTTSASAPSWPASPPSSATAPPGPAGRRPSADEASPAGAPLGPDLSELTLRELDVLDLVARGHDNATIAGLLGLSPRTVRNHLNSVFSKLNVAYRPQAVVLAREAGLGTGTPRYADRPARPTR